MKKGGTKLLLGIGVVLIVFSVSLSILSFYSRNAVKRYKNQLSFNRMRDDIGLFEC